MALERDQDENIVSSSLPTPEGESRKVWPHPDWEPWTRTPRRQRDGKRPPIGSIVTQEPLLPWERRRLHNLFPNSPATTAGAYALMETFYDDQGIPTMGKIRTVVLTRPDGKRVEYRTGRLRGYNTTNRRSGLRGALTEPPVILPPDYFSAYPQAAPPASVPPSASSRRRRPRKERQPTPTARTIAATITKRPRR